ncbi:MAG TPA: amidohydrolase [Candidatus Avichristensenella intestinipullorum]|uniref:Amidohydrolase n=1 Tax=Candidatus Avichristensenella intestinipullorum TaxID=2840693 RepID=A0A9D1CJ33_9FIRM|nr:amidohydrolase [Candidatus Avichristensenella intestinipullorum]
MLLIRNAKLLTMGERDFPDGADLLVQDGRVVAVGADISAPGARVVDAKGLYALPGIVDAHCHIGLWEDGMGSEGSDGNEYTAPVTPEMRGIDGLNPFDPCWKEALEAGVTTVATGPGSANVVGGQFVAMKTTAGPLEGRVLCEPLALKTAFGENPKRVYGGKKQQPSTRMATAALFRQAMIDGLTYAQKMAQEDESKRPDRSLAKDILAMAATGRLLVKAHAHRADDILTALRLRDEFGLKMTIEHCTEGYLIAEELRRANVPIIVGPLITERSKIELRNLTFKAPAALHAAGVRFAMMTDHPVIPLQYLILSAALAVRSGLPEREALRSITINGAWAIGMDGRLGSLEPGKDADFALYDGHPLDARSHVRQVYVNGELVSEG